MASGSSSKFIPDSVMEAVKRTSSNIDEVKANLEEFLKLCDSETLSQLEPLERAQALFLIAKVNTALVTLRLRCKGVNPDNHPVGKEIERLRIYEEKLQKCKNLSKAPLRPSATINPKAAARFIEHSLSDLSPEQKKSMKEISRGEVTRIKYVESIHKKRKCQSSEKQSVRAAAQEFLEKATSELLGESQSGIKGPLQVQPESSDDDCIVLD